MTAVATPVRDLPILMSGAMVRATLDDRKSQTRRVVTDATSTGNYPASCLLLDDPRAFVDTGPSPAGNVGPYLHAPVNAPAVERRYGWKPGDCDPTVIERLYPRYAVGDRLWVRETFSWSRNWDPSWATETGESRDLWYWADGNPDHGDWLKPRPSIHLPRWASRLTLEITRIRIERLQAISDADVAAEGVRWQSRKDGSEAGYIGAEPRPSTEGWFPPRICYWRLWNLTNGRRARGAYAWERNPWVFVIEFRRVER